LKGNFMQYLLAALFGIAAFAGYKGWPLYTVVLFGAAFVAWNLAYFGTGSLKIAAGGPPAYLLRTSIISIIQAAALYGVGVGVRYLIG
jgi:hypothetical protein